MKDWFCLYQFDRRFVDESARCPHHSAEPEEGPMLVRDHDGVAWSDEEIELHAVTSYTWQEVSCFACNARDGQCAIERRLIEGEFGSLENYERWQQEHEQRQKDWLEKERQRDREMRSRNIYEGTTLTRGDKTYLLDGELGELFLQAQIGNIHEEEFYKALEMAKVVAND